jgi:hypothetical protein
MSAVGIAAIGIGLAALGCAAYAALAMVMGAPRPERDMRRRRAF